jgi:hypothetical protein
MERSQTRKFRPKENQPIKSETNRLQKTKRQPRKQKLPSQDQQKKSQQKLRSKIIKLAKTPFTTPYPFNEIRFNVEEDLSRERKLCDKIITLLHKWEDSHQMPINGNAVFMHIQSHGVEKVITTDLADANTIGDYVMTKYELSEKELDDFDNYIQNQIRYSSTVPSGYCNVLQSPVEPSVINSDTIEYELVSMYMKRYHSRDSGSSSNGQGLNVLFDILRLRKRYFFETLNANTRIPKNSGLDNNFFIKDIHKVWKNIEDTTSKEYSTKSGVGINNKSFIFSPNEGETDNNLYGIHLFSYDNDELNAQNLSQEPVSQSVFNFGPPPTAIQRILNFFSSNTTTTTTKPEIIRRIQTKLTADKHLTLADIFLLGWAIGKKLFIFDPSCNAIENRTNTMKTRGFSYTKAQRGEDAARDSNNLLSTGQNIITTQEVDNYGYGSQMSPTPSQSQSQMSPTLSRTPSQSQSQMSSTSWWRGGKKRNTKRRKTKAKSKTKRTRKTRRTRHI